MKKHYLFGGLAMLIPLAGLTAYFWSDGVKENDSTDNRSEETIVREDIVVEDYIVDEVSVILGSNIDDDLKMGNLVLIAQQKTSIERHTDAIEYYEAVLTLNDVNQEIKDTIMYDILNLAKVMQDNERTVKYTQILGEDKIAEIESQDRYELIE